jgi:hypothetical protein
MNFAKYFLFVCALLAAYVLAEPEAVLDPKKDFEEAEKRDIDLVSPALKDTFEEAAVLVKKYEKNPAMDVLRTGLFVLKHTEDETKDKFKVFYDAVKASKDHSNQRALRLLKYAETFSTIILTELGSEPKLPDDHNAKMDTAKYAETKLEDLKEIVEMAKKLKSDLKLEELGKLMKEKKDYKLVDQADVFSVDKMMTQTAEIAKLVMKVLPLNAECEQFRFLLARLTNHIGVVCQGMCTLDKSITKDFAKVWSGHLGKQALKTACTIRPLYTTAVFRIVLSFVLGMAVILGIITVVMSKKADAKQH